MEKFFNAKHSKGGTVTTLGFQKSRTYLTVTSVDIVISYVIFQANFSYVRVVAVHLWWENA